MGFWMIHPDRSAKEKIEERVARYLLMVGVFSPVFLRSEMKPATGPSGSHQCSGPLQSDP